MYRESNAAKGDDESFSGVVERLLAVEQSEHPLDRLAGLLAEDEVDRVRERMEAFRTSLDEGMDRYACFSIPAFR